MRRIKQLTTILSGGLALGILMLSGLRAEAADITIDDTNFPDNEFRTYVSSNCDTDGDGVLSAAEIAAVTEIHCAVNGSAHSGSITSLKGVEFFTALEELECFNNRIRTLDMSANPALTTLLCQGNSLDELDVSGNPALVTLDCHENHLTSLDVSANPLLKFLSCEENGNATTSLANLDVSHNLALESLWCEENGLESLDVSYNTKLEQLYCDANKLTSLDVSRNAALKELSCGENQLTSLDVSQNTALEYLHCKHNQLTALDVSANPALEWIGCSWNNLTSLDVSHNTALETLLCRYNALTSLELGQNAALELIYCMYNQLTLLDVRDCPNIRNVVLNGTKDDSKGYVKYDLDPYMLVVDSDVTVITDDISYAVSFAAGDGTGTMNPVTVTSGGIYTLPDNGFTAPENKVFDKWDLGNVGDAITVTADTVVTALWKDKAEHISVNTGSDNGNNNGTDNETDNQVDNQADNQVENQVDNEKNMKESDDNEKGNVKDHAENNAPDNVSEGEGDEDEDDSVAQTADAPIAVAAKSPRTQDQSECMLWWGFLFAGGAGGTIYLEWLKNNRIVSLKGGKHEHIGKY